MASLNVSDVTQSGGDLLSQQAATSGSFSVALLGSLFAAVFVSLILLDKYIAAPIDPREPPVYKSSLPIVGHWISINTQWPQCFKQIAKSAGPISTLPILNKKMYVINSSPVIQSGMRNKLLGFGERVEEIAKGLNQPMETIARLVHGDPAPIDELSKITIASLSGDNLARLNVNALGWIADQLNKFEPGSPFVIDDFSDWCRDFIAMATGVALYGKNSPLNDPEILRCIQDYESGMGKMQYGWLSKNVICPKAFEAAKKLHIAKMVYYSRGLERGDDVSALIQNRARFWRDFGFDTHALAGIDTLPLISTVNTAPTMYWLLAVVFASDERLARVRREVESTNALTLADEVSPGAGRAGVIDTGAITKSCPYLVACYREVLRFYNNVTGSRTVTKSDTYVTDHESGRQYLLKKGVTVQWSAGVTHNEPQWGEHPERYEPERWLDAPLEENKDRRESFIPFGGGKHLCPGRNLAYTEILGTLACLAVGFDIEGVKVPGHKLLYEHAAVAAPIFGKMSPRAVLSRRLGWEDVTWSFK